MGRNGYKDLVINSPDYIVINNSNLTYNLQVARNLYMSGTIPTNSSIYQTADEILGFFYKSGTTQIGRFLERQQECFQLLN